MKNGKKNVILIMKVTGHVGSDIFVTNLLIDDIMDLLIDEEENPTMNLIKEKRNQAGLSQRKLADLAGIHYRTIQQWEAGTNQPTDVYVLHRVAKVLNCTIEDLIIFEEE